MAPEGLTSAPWPTLSRLFSSLVRLAAELCAAFPLAKPVSTSVLLHLKFTLLDNSSPVFA